MKPPVTIDIENDDDRLLCVAWQTWDEPTPHVLRGETWQEQWASPHIDEWMVLNDMLADPDRPKAEWSKYDANWLVMHGWDFQGPIWDGMVMAWLINENTPLGLEWCVKRYLHEQMDKRIRSSNRKPVFKQDDGREVPLGEAPIEEVMAYCVRDVDPTTRLMQRLKKRMEETAWWTFYEREHLPFTSVLHRIETRGLPVDLEASEVMRGELEVESAELGTELHERAKLPESFNLNSGPQLSALLFSKVFELTDSLTWTSEEIECLKSCLKGEHDDCDLSPGLPERAGDGRHIMDLLPDGFTIDNVGRLKVHGRWTLKGLGLTPGIPTPSGDRPSTSSPALLTNLSTATHPWVTDLLRYRKMTKVLTTYLRRFPEVALPIPDDVKGEARVIPGEWFGSIPAHGHKSLPAGLEDEWELCTDNDCQSYKGARVHGRFNQTGTVTGRLSSSQPNLQNIPAHGELGPRVRNLFRAVEGTTLLVGDYSQLEPRLMAHFSQDPFLLDVYQSGKDIYREIAAVIWGTTAELVSDEQRGIAKTYVLALGYGAGIKKLQQILTINGYPIPLRDVEWQFGNLREATDVFFRWREAVIRRAHREGYVQTIAGQHRRLSAQFKQTTWKARGYGERQAVNAIIQGSAGDVVRRTMLEFDRHEPDLRMLAQVHDELVWEYDDGFPMDEEYLASVATRAVNAHEFKLTVPLVFEPHAGATWYEAKEGTTFVLPEDFAGAFEDEDREVDE